MLRYLESESETNTDRRVFSKIARYCLGEHVYRRAKLSIRKIVVNANNIVDVHQKTKLCREIDPRLVALQKHYSTNVIKIITEDIQSRQAC